MTPSLFQWSVSKPFLSLDLLQVRTAYKKLMVDLVTLLGEQRNTEEMMMEIYDFEETLAKVSHSSGCVSEFLRVTFTALLLRGK